MLDIIIIVNKHYQIIQTQSLPIGTYLSSSDLNKILGRNSPMTPSRLRFIKSNLHGKSENSSFGKRVTRWLETCSKLYPYVPNDVYEFLKSLAYFMAEHSSGKKTRAYERFAFIIAREISAQRNLKLPITVFKEAFGVKASSKELFIARQWLIKHNLIEGSTKQVESIPAYDLAISLAGQIEFNEHFDPGTIKDIIISYKEKGIIPRVRPERAAYIMILSALKQIGFIASERRALLVKYVSPKYKDKIIYLDDAQKRFRSYHKLS